VFVFLEEAELLADEIVENEHCEWGKEKWNLVADNQLGPCTMRLWHVVFHVKPWSYENSPHNQSSDEFKNCHQGFK